MSQPDPNRPEKVYPGNLSTFTALNNKAELSGEPADIIAAQLAGLSYILDGIRYSLRDKS